MAGAKRQGRTAPIPVELTLEHESGDHAVEGASLVVLQRQDTESGRDRVGSVGGWDKGARARPLRGDLRSQGNAVGKGRPGTQWIQAARTPEDAFNEAKGGRDGMAQAHRWIGGGDEGSRQTHQRLAALALPLLASAKSTEVLSRPGEVLHLELWPRRGSGRERIEGENRSLSSSHQPTSSLSRALQRPGRCRAARIEIISVARTSNTTFPIARPSMAMSKNTRGLAADMDCGVS